MSHCWRHIAQQEQRLFARLFSGWKFFAFLAGIIILLLFLYNSHNFIFAYPDFLILVLAPPVITWNSWALLRGACRSKESPCANNATASLMDRLPILLLTLKICLFFLFIFKLLPTLFIAPYDVVSYSFWVRISSFLTLQCLMFGVMSMVTSLHARPYLFFAFTYFPVAGLNKILESSAMPHLGLWTGALLVLSVVCILASSRKGNRQ